MNWLFWAAERLWSHYYQNEAKARALRSFRGALAGAGLTLLGFLLGFCSLGLLLLSSFFFFLDQARCSLAALGTALLCSALTLTVWFFGNRFFHRSLKV